MSADVGRWEHRRLKYVVTFNERKLADATEPGLALRYVDISTVNRLGEVSEPQQLHFEDAPSRARRLAETGDTVISTVRTYLEAIAYVDEPIADCVFSTGFAVLHPGPSLEARYLYYAIRSAPFLAEVARRSVGVSYPAVNPSDLADISIPVPPLKDQRAIAAMLDAETARLDTLAAHKRRLRGFSVERLSAIRTRVTSGAGPVRPLGRTVRLFRGTTFPHRAQGEAHGTYPFVKVRDFTRAGNESTIVDADNWVSAETASELRATVVPAGAVIVPRVGMAMRSNPRRVLGRPCILDDNQLGLLLTTDGEPRYLYHWLSTVDLAAQANPGPVPSVTESDIFRLRIPWPSRSKQREIADRLDRELNRVMRLTSELNRSVDFLAERRRSLISQAVAGDFEPVRPATGAA